MDMTVLESSSAEAAAAGLSVTSIGTTVRAAYEGIVATSIQELDEDIDIRVSFPRSVQETRESLQQIQIPNRVGALVPLSSVATFSNSQGLAIYEHEENRRQVRVTANVDTNKLTAITANALIRAHVPEFNKTHPDVSFHFGGEEQDT
ncbi:MAG: efflux RND transporter permease subunit, partial [Chloroflexi bacterium]|nr:efflux RND transporter permease subunit [Chloroflexota bacterium]